MVLLALLDHLVQQDLLDLLEKGEGVVRLENGDSLDFRV